MHLMNSIIIQAKIEKIFDVAARIEDWPQILPHYRWVKILQRQDQITMAEMAASRSGFPVKWTSIQVLHPNTNRISYRHIKGITNGMVVEWNLEQKPDGVHVSIYHDLKDSVPFIGEPLTEIVVGRLFIHSIADHTLGCIRNLLENRMEVQINT